MGGRPMVRGRGVEDEFRAGAPAAAGAAPRGAYGGTESEYWAVEWYDGASETCRGCQLSAGSVVTPDDRASVRCPRVEGLAELTI